MAIEIRELVIRARIEPGRKRDSDRPGKPRDNTVNTDKYVVDDIMRILKDQRER